MTHWIAGFVLGLLLVPASAFAGPDTRLPDAMEQRNAGAVFALLKHHVDANAAQADGTTALHWAAHWNDLDAANALIRAGANAGIVNRYGVTPLVLACENGAARLIEALIKAGANPNVASSGEPPIMVASRSGSVDALKALIANGGNVNATESWRGQTALMWAAAENHVGVARVLLDSGADVTAHSPGGFSPLLFAAREGSLDVARLLVERGARLDDTLKTGSPAMTVAITSLNYELAAFLVTRGANVNLADRSGSTPLHALIQARNPGATSPLRTGKGTLDSLGMLETLLAAGANPNARTAAVQDRETNERAILIDVGLNLGGATPFLLAARGADAEAMRHLLAHGADPRLPTLEGVTPLMVAAGVGYVETSDAGANTELELLESLRLLLDLGADVNAASQHGQTALHGSVYRGIDSIIRLLAGRGAKVDAKDQYGRTPLTLAQEGFNNMGHYRREDQAALLRNLYPASH